MPLWVVTEALEVTFTGSDNVVQYCGKADPRVLTREVLAWVFTQAAVADRIQTPDGTFVRQAAPGTH